MRLYLRADRRKTKGRVIVPNREFFQTVKERVIPQIIVSLKAGAAPLVFGL